MSKLIYKIKPSADIIGNSSPPRTGAFEVKIDNKIVHSKFNSNDGDFPTESQILNWFK